MTADSPTLAPCPFCGSTTSLDYDRRVLDPNRWSVSCCATDCICEGPSRATKREAIAAWNHRPALPPAPAPEREGLLEALRWYEALARDCRKVTDEGERARHTLEKDQGSTARAAIAAYEEGKDE